MGGNKPDIIRALFAAYLSDDRNAVEHFLTDDFRFTSPYDTRSTRPPISRVAGAAATGSNTMRSKKSSWKAMRPL